MPALILKALKATACQTEVILRGDGPRSHFLPPFTGVFVEPTGPQQAALGVIRLTLTTAKFTQSKCQRV